MKIEKLEQKTTRLKEDADKARGKIPERKVKIRKFEFDEKSGKGKPKLAFELENIPIGEAKWNRRAAGGIRACRRRTKTLAINTAVNKIHAAVHSAEHENVGVHAAHRAELLGESAYRGTKRTAKSAYRLHKNRPYRKAAKFEAKSIKTEGKLSYKKALRDNPKLKSNIFSRIAQKRAVKRKYTAAKKAGKATKKSVGITAKLSKLVTGIIRKNPIVLGKLVLLGLLIILLVGMFSMCGVMFAGGAGFLGVAEDFEQNLVGSPFDFDWRPFMTSGFGYRIHPISGEETFHFGIDISVPERTPILAGFNGVVAQVGYHQDGYGNFIVTHNGEGISVLYAHCYSILAQEGQSVLRGEVIATVGNTGASTGAHLHLEVIQGGQRIDPMLVVGVLPTQEEGEDIF